LQGLERGLQVFEAVAEHQPVGVGELARVLGISKSSVQRNLTGLANAGWIKAVPGDQTKWTLTTRALRVGLRGSSEGRLREIALGPMRDLRDTTNETVTLQVRDANRMVLIERVDPPRAVRSFLRIGTVTPLSVTSGGLAFLAMLPAAEQDRILAEPIEQFTPLTIVDPDAVREQLRVARELGYAVNHGQNRTDVCAVGTAVLDPSGREPVATMGISMPMSRFTEDRVPEWGEQVTAAAAAVTALL
jgi:IclR family transcriptional regulator, acetate operon repressor